MATYLLLRNNRETGPLSKEQLLALGLKPYDLIWVEGRSAAWRYANEIVELKEHAPAVEEQPFDRFYKKNTPDPIKEFVDETVKRHASEPVKKYVEETFKEKPQIAATEAIVHDYINQLKKEHGAIESSVQQTEEYRVPASNSLSSGEEENDELFRKYGNQKKVVESTGSNSSSVDDPDTSEEIAGGSINDVLGRQLTKGRNGAVSVIMPVQNNVAKREEVPVKKVAVSEAKQQPVIKKVTVPIPDYTLEDSPVDMETKYSTPLDEIKERYVKQLTDRKQASANRKYMVTMMKRAAIFIVIIGAGVLIGFAIKPGRTNKGQVAETTLQTAPAINNAEPAKDDVVLTNTTLPQEAVSSTTNDDIALVPVEKKVNDHPVTRPENEKKETQVAEPDPGVIESNNGERNKNVRSGNTEAAAPVEKRNIAGSDLSDQVSVEANDYKERDFGGFRNLQLTVTNESKVTLESVIVELAYKKYNDDILSTKHITFEAISPGDALTIKVPDNNRGAKLSYRIIRIDPRN